MLLSQGSSTHSSDPGVEGQQVPAPAALGEHEYTLSATADGDGVLQSLAWPTLPGPGATR
nr:hypothetical protein [Mycobacterium malmoense]